MNKWKQSSKERGLRVQIGKYMNLIKINCEDKNIQKTLYYVSALQKKLNALTELTNNNFKAG